MTDDPGHAHARARRASLRRGGALAVLALGLAGGGCDACRNDHPYVPYGIDAAPSVARSPVDAAREPAPATPAPDGGDATELAPPHSATWEHAGLRLEAPAGQTFERGLFADLDGDGRLDALCVLRVDAAPRSFEVRWYRGGEPDSTRVLATELATLPESPGAHVVTRVGARSALVEVGTAPAAAFAETRAFVLVDVDVAPGRPPAARARLSFVVTDPPRAPRLTVTPDSADRDGDGVADLTLTVSVADADGPLDARLAFFDRPAGLARDPDEPRVSLAAHAATALKLARAARSKDAPAALRSVARASALARAVCPELAGARLSGFVGAAAPRCAGAAFFEDLALAEVRASAAAGWPFATVAAMARWRGPLIGRTKDKVREAERALDAAAPQVAPRSVRTLRVVPRVPKRHVPSFGPLAFASHTELDVLTAGGVVRADLVASTEVESPTPAWPQAVLSPGDGARLVEVYDACRGGPPRATFAPAEDGDAGDPRELVVPAPVALAPPCRATRGEPVPVAPLAWGPKGLEAFVAGEPVLFEAGLARAVALDALLDQPPSRGSARSPDGRWAAVGTELGVVVAGPGGARRIQSASEPSLARRLVACAVNDGGTYVACLDGARVIVVELPER